MRKGHEQTHRRSGSARSIPRAPAAALKRCHPRVPSPRRVLSCAAKLAPAYNQLAWELATAERQAIRDGPRAVEMALKACELSEWKNPTYIDTLAAAYARAGHFEEAVKWQHKAMDNSQRANDDKASQRLRLYERGTPWPPD